MGDAQVQEYDADCPPPNTNRTYLSYVDSVRYLATTPPNARSPAALAARRAARRRARREAPPGEEGAGLVRRGQGW